MPKRPSIHSDYYLIDPVRVLGQPPPAPIPIRIDTREQHPLLFDRRYARSVRDTVPIFDYCIDGDFGYAVERKSVSDCISSFTSGLDAERKKIEKARLVFEPGTPITYVVEGAMSDMFQFRWERFPKATSQWFFSTLATLQVDHGIQFIFCRNRVEASLWVYRLLKTRWKTFNKSVGRTPR